MDQLIGNLRWGGRTWVRRPGLAAAFVATLALGVGANVAVFSVLRAALMKELPYPDAKRIVTLSKVSGGPMPSAFVLSEFEAIRDRSGSFQAVAACDSAVSGARGSADAEQILVTRVTDSFFALFGLSPIVGRTFSPGDFSPGSRVVVISFDLWTSQFNRAADVIGQTIRLNREPWTVVGIMPAAFASSCASAGGRVLRTAWVPLAVPKAAQPPEHGPRRSAFVSVFGRLVPQATTTSARTDVAASIARLADRREDGGESRVRVERLPDSGVEAARPGLLMLQGVTALVLVIACGNLANLLFAAATARCREIAVRLALGAPRHYVVRQLMTEAAMVASVGGVIGVALAYSAVPSLVRTGGLALPPGTAVQVRLPELAFGLVLSWLVAMVCAVAPALAVTNADARGALHGAIRLGSSRPIRVLRNGLIAVQVFLAVLVLTGAGLFAKSFMQVFAVPMGFESRGLIAAELGTLRTITPMDGEGSAGRRFQEAVRARLRAGTVAFSSAMPFLRAGTIDGTLLGLAGTEPRNCYSEIRAVSSEYFDVLGQPLVAGQLLASGARAASGRPAVVNEAFARRYSHGRSLVGYQLVYGKDEPFTIIGIVRDTRSVRLTFQPFPAVYVPSELWPSARVAVVVRGADLQTVSGAVRDAARSVDPDLPLANIVSVDAEMAARESARVFYLHMMSICAALAGLLAAVGIFGVTAHLTSLRAREFGIRIALGATPRTLNHLVVRHGLRPILVGLVGGVIATWWVTELLKANTVFMAQLYKTAPHDVWIVTGATIGLLAISIAACWIPARLAARVDPVSVLRVE